MTLQDAALGALALAVVACAIENAANASEGQVGARQVVVELLSEAHYDGPPPKVETMTAERVRDLCGCAPKALYAEGAIYLLPGLDLDEPFDRSVLFHELVHHIQWVARGTAGDCSEWHRREVFAHAAQNAWLAEHRVGRRVVFTGGCR